MRDAQAEYDRRAAWRALRLDVDRDRLAREFAASLSSDPIVILDDADHAKLIDPPPPADAALDDE